MSLALECPQCGRKLKAADDACGKKIKCPECATLFTVESPAQSAADNDNASGADAKPKKKKRKKAKSGDNTVVFLGIGAAALLLLVIGVTVFVLSRSSQQPGAAAAPKAAPAFAGLTATRADLLVALAPIRRKTQLEPGGAKFFVDDSSSELKSEIAFLRPGDSGEWYSLKLAIPQAELEKLGLTRNGQIVVGTNNVTLLTDKPIDVEKYFVTHRLVGQSQPLYVQIKPLRTVENAFPAFAAQRLSSAGFGADKKLTNGKISSKEGPLQANVEFTVGDFAGYNKVTAAGSLQYHAASGLDVIWEYSGDIIKLKWDDQTIPVLTAKQFQQAEQLLGGKVDMELVIKKPMAPGPYRIKVMSYDVGEVRFP